MKKLLVLFLILSLVPNVVNAAPIWRFGAELNTVTAGVEFTSSGTNVATSTSIKRSGVYSLRVNPSAGFQWFGQVYAQGVTTTPQYAKACIYVAAMPTAGRAEIISAYSSGAAARRGYIVLGNDNKLGMYYGTTLIGASSTALSTNTHYCVEMLIDLNSTTMTMRLDGVQIATSASVSGMVSYDAFYFGSPTAAATFDVYYDDMGVNDTTGTGQTSWVGLGKVIRLTPNAAGDVNTFTTQTGGTAGSANNYTRTSESVTTNPDDATTFNGSSAVNEEDLFNVTDSGIGSGDTVNAVMIGARYRNSTADTAAAFKVELLKTSAGTVASSSAIVPNSTTWKTSTSTTARIYSIATTTDPNNAAWTQATLDTMQIGYKLTTAPAVGGQRVDVSTVWAMVDYTPAAVVSTPASTSEEPIFF